MKRKYMLMFGIIFYFIFLVIIAVIVYYYNSSPLWQDGVWFLAYLKVVEYLFYFTVPVLLFALILGVWDRDGGGQPSYGTANSPRPENPAPANRIEGINCPNCDRWLSTRAHACPECELPVANMAMVSKLKKMHMEGRMSRDEYADKVRRLM